MLKPNNPNKYISKTKLPTSRAVLFGLLTFIITPITAFVVAIPFYFLSQLSDSYNPLLTIANIFGLRELSGFFAAQFILLMLSALLGNFVTAVISWFVNRSKKLAVITFASAFIFQCIVIFIVFSSSIKESGETIKATIESEKSYQKYAKIEDVTFNVKNPYTDFEIKNRYPEYGPIYKKLLINIPILVLQPGTYQVNVRYSFAKEGARSSTPMKKAIKALDVGNHIIQIEFLAHEISGYGFWSSSSVGGIADVHLSYLASEEELLDKMETSSALEKRTMKQFFMDEGFDEREADKKSKIKKFIERKKIHF